MAELTKLGELTKVAELTKVGELTKVPELTKVGEVLIKRAKLINSVLAEAHLYRNSMGGWYDDTGKFR